jgi:hypothetical protein
MRMLRLLSFINIFSQSDIHQDWGIYRRCFSFWGLLSPEKIKGQAALSWTLNTFSLVFVPGCFTS